MAHYPLYTQNLSLVGVCVKRIGKLQSKTETGAINTVVYQHVDITVVGPDADDDAGSR